MSIHTINKVKGWVKRFLPFYLFTFLPLNALAQEQPQRTYTAEHPLIYEDVWDLWPYCFLNEKGEPDGFNVELIKLIFKELGIPYTIKLTSRQEAFTATTTSTDSTARTPSRCLPRVWPRRRART